MSLPRRAVGGHSYQGVGAPSAATRLLEDGVVETTLFRAGIVGCDVQVRGNLGLVMRGQEVYQHGVDSRGQGADRVAAVTVLLSRQVGVDEPLNHVQGEDL